MSNHVTAWLCVAPAQAVARSIDNITNEKYHLFHPFPQRTYVVQGRVTF